MIHKIEMPYKCDTLKLIIPKVKGKDRRYKLTEQEKDEIRENMEGLSNRKLGIKYKVDRKVIKYVKDPIFYEQMLSEAKIRRADHRYYDKEKHREAIKNTRHYRHKILSIPKTDDKQPRNNKTTTTLGEWQWILYDSGHTKA